MLATQAHAADAPPPPRGAARPPPPRLRPPPRPPPRRRRRRRAAADPAAAAAAAGGADSGAYTVRLRGLEKNVNELKEQIFRTKARLNLLKETVLGGVIGASRAVIHHKNEMGSSFRLIKAAYALDGVQIYAKSDERRPGRDAGVRRLQRRDPAGIAHAVGRAAVPGQRLRRVQLPQGLQVQRQVEPHLRRGRVEDHEHHGRRLREGQHHHPALRQAGDRFPRQRHGGRRKRRGDGARRNNGVHGNRSRASSPRLRSALWGLGRGTARADEVDDIHSRS